MKDWLMQIVSEGQQAFAGNLIFPLYLFSLVYLFLTDPDKRRSVTGPSILLMVLIFEPHLYNYVYIKMLRYAYWRMLWLIPAVPVIACAAVEILTKLPRKWMKTVAVLSYAVIVCVGGTYTYSAYSENYFTRAVNAYKIPQDVIDTGKALLELDAHPRVVMSPDLCVYARVYSADITQMYGRDAWGFIGDIDGDTATVAEQMQQSQPDFSCIAGIMRNKGFSYLVIRREKDPGQDQMLGFGFQFCSEVDGFEIYRLTS